MLSYGGAAKRGAKRVRLLFCSGRHERALIKVLDPRDRGCWLARQSNITEAASKPAAQHLNNVLLHGCVPQCGNPAMKQKQ